MTQRAESTYEPKEKLDGNDSAPIIINELYFALKNQPPPDTFTVKELVNWIPDIQIQPLISSITDLATEDDRWSFSDKAFYRLVQCAKALEWKTEYNTDDIAFLFRPAPSKATFLDQWVIAYLYLKDILIPMTPTRAKEKMLGETDDVDDSIFKDFALRKATEAIEAINKIHVFALEHNDKLRHPIAPLVKAFIDAPPKIKPENRETAIAPEGLRHATRPTKQGELFEVGSLPTGEIEPSQGWLPGLEIPDSQIVPALPLEIYEASGGLPLAPGRGAPLAQRIFINALLAYPAGERRGDTVELTTTLRDIKQWLYPKGHKETKRVFLKRLRKALVEVHNYRISWERRDWHIIGVEALPNLTTKLDDPLPFTIKLPEGMDTVNGALVDLHPLRLYGATSAPKFRAWIRLAYIWDNAKALNGGHRIYATRPKAKRDDRGRLLDAKGELIRGKAGKAATNWNHANAICEGTEPNPAREKVPVLSDKDMVRLFFDNKEVPKGTFRKRLHDAKNHALEMEKDGHVVVEQNVKDPKTGVTGWRILEPRKDEVYNR